MIVKGMVQVSGTTYRIARVMPHVYEAVRILDNEVAGWFTSDLSTITPNAVDLATLQSVARLAVQQGKTSWVGRVDAGPAKTPEPADRSGVRRIEPDASVRADLGRELGRELERALFVKKGA